MKNKVISKEEKIDLVLDLVKKNNLTAYEIAKNTGLNASGIERILKGEVKNPQNDTLNKILGYIEEKLLGSGLEKNYLEEPKTEYKSKNEEMTLSSLMAEYVNTTKDLHFYMQENQRLKSLLDKNNIEY